MPEIETSKRRGGATELVVRGRRGRTKASAAAAPATRRNAAENVGAIEVTFEADAELVATAEAELGPAPDLRSGHYVIDPGVLRAEVGDIIGRLHTETRARLGLDPAMALDDPVADLLAEMSLRRVTPALQLALGRAVEAGRDRLSADDIGSGHALIDRGQGQRNRIGF